MSELFTDDGIAWRFVLPAILVVLLGVFTLAYGVSRGGIGGRGGEVPPVPTQQSQAGPSVGGPALATAGSDSTAVDSTGTDSAPGR